VGKPYRTELEALANTYRWSIEAPLDTPLRSWFRLCSAPLITIGSGGSFSAATFAAHLHERYTGLPARALTPLDVVLSSLNWSSNGVLVLTARGSNPDVLGAFHQLALQEPRSLSAVCTRTKSPLGEVAKQFSNVEVAEWDIPSGKDGFLATNSLLATAVLLSRLYSSCNSSASLPTSLDELLSGEEPQITNGSVDSLWGADTLIALYSPTTRAAAIDLESKFSEAAIGNLQPVDYRNFAHGRHHWLARYGSSTGIVAFVADEVEELSTRMLRLIPRQVPILKVRVVGQGDSPAIAALVHAIRIVGDAGSAAGFDPGRPHVPAFGRKIYHLKAFRKTLVDAFPPQYVAIRRKSRSTLEALEVRGELDEWEKAWTSFSSRISRTRFGGLVFDYDGTLCDEKHRFDAIDKRISKELTRLARTGSVIGIATGRGKSVRVALQNAIPKTLWKQFVVGYYNGSEIGELKNDACPDGIEQSDPPLAQIAQTLADDIVVRKRAILNCRKHQITIESKQPGFWSFLWDYVQEVLYRLDIPGVMALRSGHSMDIVAPHVSKRNVLELVASRIGKRKSVLCMGDRGRWPGNDFSLLGTDFSLSVDEVSADPARCWNLAPPGLRGIDATLYYLSNLRTTKQGMHLDLKLSKASKTSRRK
jgi:fructoselysine-6-P-deglycase FrlB-like protein